MVVKMLDLNGQYEKIKQEIDSAIQNVLNEANFIQGSEVRIFENNLADYLQSKSVISCANGTDALQIAMMALGLQRGDEVIVPAFTYVATAEVIALLGLVPVLVDVYPDTFNIRVEDIVKSISARTKAIVPVHLFGQCANMEAIMEIASKYSLYVIEDCAQSLGAVYRFKNGITKFSGTIGHIGCTSFFPSKNLGCFGDGGAMFAQDELLAQKLKMTANHGQRIKYYHDVIGCNSRLDTIQAAILDVKLRHLDSYALARYEAAQYYKELLTELQDVLLPVESDFSTHVYHQFTIVLKDSSKRDKLKEYLAEKGVPGMIYYPLPLNRQKAFEQISIQRVPLDNSEMLANSVLSLPVHTELTKEQQQFVAMNIINFFKTNN